jgi:Tol biopolymer transport system component
MTRAASGRFVALVIASSVIALLGCSPERHASLPSHAIALEALDPGSNRGRFVVVAADGSGVVELTSAAEGRDQLTWSPDGTHFSFQTGGYAGPFLMNADGSTLRELKKKYRTFDGGAWSPDGTQLAFTIDARGDATDLQIGLLDIETEKLKIVASNAQKPAWSPDGKQLAVRHCVTRRAGAPELCDLSIANADGTGQRVLIPGVAVDSASWSPDGSRIAFIDNSLNASGTSFQTAFMIFALDGSDVKRPLDPAIGGALEFFWAPNGTQIAVLNQRSSPDGIRDSVVIMRPDGTGQRVVENPTWGGMGGLVWSPDGQRLAFEIEKDPSARIKGFELWAVDLGSGATSRLLQNACDLSWSPDGSRIAYDAPCEGRSNLVSDSGIGVWTAAADGSSPTRIVANGQFPKWRPKIKP